MENKFYIRVKPEEMRRLSNGNVIGIICCQYEAKFFPEDVWEDFVVTILDWWTGGALRLLKQTSDNEELLFMDGPFAMTLEMRDDSQYEMTWIDQQQEENFSFAIDFQSFLEQLTKASESVIHKCQSEKWDPEDLNSLINGHKMLIAAMAT